MSELIGKEKDTYTTCTNCDKLGSAFFKFKSEDPYCTAYVCEACVKAAYEALVNHS